MRETAADLEAALAVAPVDERVYTLLAESGVDGDLFNQRQHRCCELVDRYGLHLAVATAGLLDLAPALAVPRTAAEVAATRGFVRAFHPALEWLLERLAGAGFLHRETPAPGGRYRLPRPLPSVSLAPLRDAVLDRDPTYGPTFALLDEAAAVYPRVARGETTGEQALFQKVAIWTAYFNNTNPFYALNNRLAAQVAAARLPAGGGQVLEVGAGLGSGTEALLGRLQAMGRLALVTAYHVTEPVPFFRRRAQRALDAAWPAAPLRFADLDLNRSWEAQGVPAASVDLVWAVNVFHLARELDQALEQAFRTLAPGGWIVLGEGIRPFPGQVVGAEFPFQLLRSFVEVGTDPELRPTHGFLAPEHWVAALGRAGFERPALVPDLFRVREVFSGFFAGVVCGRRPVE